MIDPAANLQESRPQLQRMLLLGAALGLGVALLVLVDPVLIRRMGWLDFTRIPYVYALGFLIVAAATCLAVLNAAWLFARRYEIAAFAVVAAGALTGFNIGPLDPTDVVLLAVLLIWAGAALLEMRPLQTPIAITLLLLALVPFLIGSVVNGQLLSILMLHTMISKIALVFLLTNILVTPHLHGIARKTVLIVGVASALLGLASEVIYVAFDFPITFDELPEFHYKQTPLGVMLRVTAFMPSSQGLAHMLLLTTAIALFEPMRAWMRLACIAVLGAGVACTFSAGACMIFASILAVYPFLRWTSYSLHYAAALGAAALIIWSTGAMNWLNQNVVSALASLSAADRIEYIQVALQGIERHPFLGIGLRNIGRLSGTPVHNAYLQTATDLGIGGGLAFTAIVLYLAVRPAFLLRRATSQRQANVVRSMLLGGAAIAVHLLFEPFYDNYFTWLFLGLIAACITIYSKPQPWETHA